ncbi:unnamed protein product [Cladocopium goreaui]|uniref:N-acetyltransferase domain-containing protein n=1 Tax=Cladocopium goreaui TaxID=2562237 RepID=A0A9P1BZJ0_9DINO|nr:unnamed protein product [Cladocopium goreaui]
MRCGSFTMAGTETLRYKDELDQVKDRIGGLLQQLESEEDPRAKQRLQKKVTRRVSRVVNLEPVEAETQPPETFHDVREKLDDLLGQLHLEERQHVLSQVVEWFVGHTPAAQKDIAVLERADKERILPDSSRGRPLPQDDCKKGTTSRGMSLVYGFVFIVFAVAFTRFVLLRPLPQDDCKKGFNNRYDKAWNQKLGRNFTTPIPQFSTDGCVIY